MRRSIPHLLALLSLAVYVFSPVAATLPAFPSVDFALAVVAAAIGLASGVRDVVRARRETGRRHLWWSATAVFGSAGALGLWVFYVVSVYRALDIIAG
ncbi:MAG: hypothetical protein ABI779_01310 [Acidobacteriota bacterium]